MLKNIIYWIKRNLSLYRVLKSKRIKRLIQPAEFYLVRKNKKPISDCYGKDRGTPLDRYYIDKFICQNRKYVQGKCLEIKSATYIQKYGDDNVSSSDILDIDLKNQIANIHDDLRDIQSISSNTYDCIILTQVLQFVDDYKAAIRECYKILKPGGILLVTTPAISRIDCRAEVKNDFWRFTKAGMQYSFDKVFDKDNVVVNTMGSVLSGLAFWVGMAQEDLKASDLEYNDPNFPVIVTIKAKK